MNDIYAHSVKNAPMSEWETLDCHLRNVMQTAGIHAGSFGAAEWGQTAGLLHDLGKAKNEFQQKIRGKKIKVSHSGEGARYAQEHFNPIPGRMISYCIAGHHSGLPNGGRNRSQKGRPTAPLDERIEDSRKMDIPEGFSFPDLGIPASLNDIETDSRMFALQFFIQDFLR